MKLSFLKKIVTQLENLLNRIRTRIPGLPSNRSVFSAVGLVIAVAILLGTIQFLLAPKDKFTTFTLPYEQNFDDVNLRRWFLGDGVWTIRDSALAQTVGGDTSAQVFIPSKLIEDTPYHASVYITLKKDTREAGISFNAQYPNMTAKQQRIYLSRPDPNTLFLVAGYMDTSGSFITQIQVPLSINTTEFRLDLYVYQNTYIVQLNGQKLIEDRPLFYKNGLIGFYTLGPAIFDTFKLTSADNPNPGNLVYTSDFDQNPGGAGWVPFAGTWKIADKKMVQSDPVVLNAGMGYETSTFQNFTLRATFNHNSGQGAGVLFNMPSPYQVNGAQVVRFSDQTDAVIWGYFDPNGAFTRQGFTSIPPAGTGLHNFQIFSGDSSFDVFLDDQLLVRDVPLQSKQGSIGLITSASSVAFSLVEVYPLFGVTGAPTGPLAPVSITGSPAHISKTPGQSTPVPKTPGPIVTKVNSTITSPTKPKPVNGGPTPGILTNTGSVHVRSTSTVSGNAKTTPVPATPGSTGSTTGPVDSSGAVIGGQSPYHGVFTGKLSDQNWVAINGAWSFQNGNFVQTRTDGFDLTAIYTKTTYKNFSYQIGLTHQQGSGAGLVFNMPNSDRLTGSSMVRYSDKRDNALIWGYFDANGVYKNQGYAEVNHAGTDHHTLRVTSGESSYSIYLDDRMVIQSVPFGSNQNNGYIGLLTSVASVAYDEVTVDGVGAAFKGNYSALDGFTDQRVVSGKWTIGNNTITQTVSNVADYLWNSGVQASVYTISSKITLPSGSSTVGGGFILNMSERGTKNNSYVVRFINGGKGILWGSNDANGKFKGQGTAKLNSNTQSMVLKVAVDAGKITISVDDKEIAANILITGVDGWIGMDAFGGPVIFQDLKLDVTQ